MDEEIYGYGEDGLVLVGKIVDLGEKDREKERFKRLVDFYTPPWFKALNERIQELETKIEELSKIAKEAHEMALDCQREHSGW